jgi:UDP-glucose 4-epimerase
VTGGAGFIGSHLVEALLGEGFDVRVVDNLATGHRSNLAHLEGRYDRTEDDLAEIEVCPARRHGGFFHLSSGSDPQRTAIGP